MNIKSKYLVKNRNGRVLAAYSSLKAARIRIQDTDYFIQYPREAVNNEKAIQNEK